MHQKVAFNKTKYRTLKVEKENQCLAHISKPAYNDKIPILPEMPTDAGGPEWGNSKSSSHRNRT